MKYKFKNLVFEGGGVKGIAYGGALEELDKMELLDSIQRAAGTSAGAIIATVYALGYSIKEIKEIMEDVPFKSFSDDDFGIIRDGLRFVFKYGWHKGDAFTEWIGKIIQYKIGYYGATFSDLERAGGKDLYIIGTNLSKQVWEVYSKELTPDMPIRDAVRISMGIPLYYTAIKNPDIMVDGGVLNNYPIGLFDRAEYLINPDNGESVDYKTEIFNHETLGFRLDSKDEIEYARRGWESIPKNINNIGDYTKALIGIILETVNKKHLHSKDWNRTVFIDTLGVKTTDFNIDKETIENLVESAREGVRNHFYWRKTEIELPI